MKRSALSSALLLLCAFAVSAQDVEIVTIHELPAPLTVSLANEMPIQQSPWTDGTTKRITLEALLETLIPSGTTPPATDCDEAEEHWNRLFFDTDADASQHLLACTPSGWEAVSGAGGGGSGDIEAVGECTSGACFPGETMVTSATTAGGDASGPFSALVVANDSHTHGTSTIAGLDAGNDISTGVLAHERGGLEADVSAFGGLVRIASGATTAVTNLSGLNTALGSSLADGPHTTDTDDQDASEVPYTATTDGDWTDPDPTEVQAALDALAERLTTEEAKADDDTPDDDSEVPDAITVGATGSVNDAAIPSGITRDTEWDTAAEINAATTDNDFSITTHTHGASTLDTDSVSADELNATGVEAELEAVLDLNELQGQIGDAQIADGAVDGGTGGEIADGSITADDLAADSVDSSEIATNAVGAAEIAANSVANSEMADDAIGAAEMADEDHGDVAWSAGVASVQAVATDAVGQLTDIAAALKSGADGTLITGTIGTTNAVLTVDANDDLVEQGLTWNITAVTCTGDGNGGALTVNGSNQIICSADDGGGGSDTNAVREIYWSAAALLPLEHGADSIPPLSKRTGTNVDALVRLFDDGTDECVGGSFAVPSDVEGGSTITFTLWWFSASATTNEAVWDIRHSGGQAEGVTWDTALTTETAAADTTQGTVDQITKTTWTETLANTSWAAGDFVSFEVCRDANNGDDDLVGDASMLGFMVSIPRA